jgi:hypothetical protein
MQLGRARVGRQRRDSRGRDAQLAGVGRHGSVRGQPPLQRGGGRVRGESGWQARSARFPEGGGYPGLRRRWWVAATRRSGTTSARGRSWRASCSATRASQSTSTPCWWLRGVAHAALGRLWRWRGRAHAGRMQGTSDGESENKRTSTHTGIWCDAFFFFVSHTPWPPPVASPWRRPRPAPGQPPSTTTAGGAAAGGRCAPPGEP